MVEGWNKDPANTVSPEGMVDAYIDFYNKCVEKAPEDLHFGLHMCRDKSTLDHVYMLLTSHTKLHPLAPFL